jgi:hypothetical protein
MSKKAFLALNLVKLTTSLPEISKNGLRSLEFDVKPRTYYYKTRLFLDTSSLSKKKHSNSKIRGFCYTVNGDKVPDEFVIAELIKIKDHLNMCVSKQKTIGSTKLCEYFKEKYGIIINHKKMRRLKHEIGLVGKYTNH